MEEKLNSYVVVDRFTGKLLVANKQFRLNYSNAKAIDGVWKYPSQARPILFKSRENAKKHLENLFQDYKGTAYVRRAKPRDLKKFEVKK